MVKGFTIPEFILNIVRGLSAQSVIAAEEEKVITARRPNWIKE
jgi:hypothetical protein